MRFGGRMAGRVGSRWVGRRGCSLNLLLGGCILDRMGLGEVDQVVVVAGAGAGVEVEVGVGIDIDLAAAVLGN